MVSSAQHPFRRRPGPLLAVLLWAVFALLLLAYALPSIRALNAADPDDYMRLAEVRDWVSGQSWFDVRQHRMGMPPGADMHWSRLVDLPIAALLIVARLFIAEPGASALAMTSVPLLELLVAMLLLRRLLFALGEGAGTALTAAALPLLFPVLTSNFMPMRIDHHAWQAICALACALALRHPGWRGCTLAGLLAAVWLSISLEGLVLVIALAGLLAWRTLRTGEAAIAPFSASLTCGGLAIIAATRPARDWTAALADQLSWPHLTAFAAAAAITAFALCLPNRRHRFGLLAVAALVAAAALLAGLGLAAIDPFHSLDPVVRHMWLENIPEGLPITRQDWQTRAILLWTPFIVLAGWRTIPRESPQARAWQELALYALAACALSLLLMRGAVAAQLLTVPFSSLLLVRWFPRAAALPHAGLRIPAMLACLMLSTPGLASIVGRELDQRVSRPRSNHFALGSSAMPAFCNVEVLASLPPARILAPLDLGPEILVRTGHSVVAGSYHRNSDPMRAVIEIFSGDRLAAPALAKAQGAKLLAFCPGSAEAGIYTARRRDNLANDLANHRPVSWLQAIPGLGGGLQVYRIVNRRS